MNEYSVIIPTYNRAYCLHRAIDSVLEQTYPAKQIIIIDDGSTDDTLSVIESYQKKYPSITFVKTDNNGVSAARNLGVSKSNSPWIAFLDSDDAWEKTKIASQMQALQKQPQYKICHTEEKWFRHGIRVNPKHKHQKFGGWIYEKCLPLCAISPSSVLIHKTIFNTIGYFDETLPACEDYDLWLRITARHPVLFVKQALTIKFGGHTDQLSKQYWGMDRFRIVGLEKMLKSSDLHKDLRQLTLDTFVQKINILINGANKRGNSLSARYYQSLLERYEVKPT